MKRKIKPWWLFNLSAGCINYFGGQNVKIQKKCLSPPSVGELHHQATASWGWNNLLAIPQPRTHDTSSPMALVSFVSFHIKWWFHFKPFALDEDDKGQQLKNNSKNQLIPEHKIFKEYYLLFDRYYVFHILWYSFNYMGFRT